MSERRRSLERDSFHFSSSISSDMDDYYKRRASSGNQSVMLSPDLGGADPHATTPVGSYSPLSCRDPVTGALLPRRSSQSGGVFGGVGVGVGGPGMMTPQTPTVGVGGGPLFASLSSSSSTSRRRDASVSSTDGPREQDGFYLLKKDSQRRTTLGRVMAGDEERICDIWFDMVAEQVGQPLLGKEHLRSLMRSLRAFIAEQNKKPMNDVIKSLKEEFDFDGASINQVQLALYLFTEAVNGVLRLHSIKPHWMFALDNLMRTAVQAAIMVLSPDLGENLAASSLAERKMSKWERQDSDSTAYNLGHDDSLASSNTLGSFLNERSIHVPAHSAIPEETAGSTCSQAADHRRTSLKGSGFCGDADGDLPHPGSERGGSLGLGLGSGMVAPDGVHTIAGVANSDAVFRLLRDEAHMREELLNLRRDNVRLLKKLLDTESSMRDTLLTIFEDQKAVGARLASIAGPGPGVVEACHHCACQHQHQHQLRRPGVVGSQPLQLPRPAGGQDGGQQQYLALPDYDSGTGTVNSLSSAAGFQDLHDWLKGLGIDDSSVQKFVMEAYALNDVLEFMDRDDLLRLELKGGVELRIWRAILDHRARRRSGTPPVRRRRDAAADSGGEADVGSNNGEPPADGAENVGNGEEEEEDEDDGDGDDSTSSPPSTPINGSSAAAATTTAAADRPC